MANIQSFIAPAGETFKVGECHDKLCGVRNVVLTDIFECTIEDQLGAFHVMGCPVYEEWEKTIVLEPEPNLSGSYGIKTSAPYPESIDACRPKIFFRSMTWWESLKYENLGHI
jgi:hypothetical protein